MSTVTDKHLHSAIFKLLRPIARLLLRNGVPFGVFSNLARHAYVDVAAKDFTIPGRKQSLSRISVLTGINRKDIARLQKESNPFGNQSANQFNRASRVVNGWLRDNDFQGEDGQPAQLAIESEDSQLPSFSKLVRLYSGDVPVRALLDELLRVGSVDVIDNEKVTLVNKAYVPEGDIEEKLRIFGTAATDLLNTLNHNVNGEKESSRFQRTVAYNNVPIEALEHLRFRSTKEMQDVLLNINQWFSQYDKDVNDELGGKDSVRAGIGIYYFEENTEDAQ